MPSRIQNYDIYDDDGQKRGFIRYCPVGIISYDFYEYDLYLTLGDEKKYDVRIGSVDKKDDAFTIMKNLIDSDFRLDVDLRG